MKVLTEFAKRRIPICRDRIFNNYCHLQLCNGTYVDDRMYVKTKDTLKFKK